MIGLTTITLLCMTIASTVNATSTVGPSMSFVKVCGPRELKEVTETVCSMLAKRDSLALAWSIRRQRMQSNRLPVRGSQNLGLLTTILPSSNGMRGKRSAITKRLAPEDMAGHCCRHPCPISYYSLFCDE